MKMITRMVVVAGMLATCHASDVFHRVKIVKISSEIQQTPQFQIEGVRDKPVDPRFWLEIEAELEVETTAKSKFIPEITAHWHAVVFDHSGKKKETVRLLGETSFKNIRTKGKKVLISAYIDPDTIEQLTGKRRLSENDIEGIALVIDGDNIIKKDKYAKGLSKATAKQASRWWENEALWKEKRTIKQGIVAKSKTPFAQLWTDRYPSEKIVRVDRP